MKTVFRAIAAAIGFIALGLQWWLEVGIPKGPGLIGSTVNFFSYFTILANTVAAFALLMPLIAPDSWAGRFLSRPSVRTALAVYLIVVGLTYFLFLRHIGNDQGWERVADQMMHYATPVLFVIDWLAFVPKGRVPLTMIGTSLVIPILYGIWMTVHGALTNWYPYPFFDASKLGYQETSVNMAIFVGVFIGIALTLIVIDRLMGSLQRHDGSDADNGAG
jgi:hypothetical protein